MEKNALGIVGTLRKNVQRRLSILQLAKEAGLSYNSCYKTVLRLERENVVVLRKEGAVRYTRVRPSLKTALLLGYTSLLEAELFLAKDAIIKKIVGELISKMQLFLDGLVLFGSYAQGKARKGSDLDLFCLSSEAAKVQVIARHLALKYDKEIQVIGATKQAFAEMLSEKGKVNVGKEVAETGIVLYGYEAYWTIIINTLLKED